MILGRVWDVEAVRSWRLLSQAGINDDRTVQLFHQLSAVFALLTAGAPSRIRTYAHGSGGRRSKFSN
jgi:hypothetical protein